MSGRLLDRIGDIETRFHYDEHTDTTTIERIQDCERILRSCHEQATENDGYTPSKDLRRFASIPLVEVERISRSLGVDVMALNKHDRAKIWQRYLSDHSRFRSI